MARPLSSNEIEMALAELPGWHFQDESLNKTFTFEDFAAALTFIVRMGLACERMDHHPHLTNVWNTVTLRLNTHDAGDKVTEKDVMLAGEIEKFGASTPV